MQSIFVPFWRYNTLFIILHTLNVLFIHPCIHRDGKSKDPAPRKSAMPPMDSKDIYRPPSASPHPPSSPAGPRPSTDGPSMSKSSIRSGSPALSSPQPLMELDDNRKCLGFLNIGPLLVHKLKEDIDQVLKRWWLFFNTFDCVSVYYD